MTTIKDIIQEKLKNFNSFVKEKFPDNILINKQIEDFNTLSTEKFVLYIKTYIRIHENSLDNFIDKLFIDYKLNKNDISTEDLENSKNISFSSLILLKNYNITFI